MEKIQFILSICLFVCAAIGVINALFVYANTNIAVVAILCLMAIAQSNWLKSVTKNSNRNDHERNGTLQTDHQGFS